MSPHPTQDDGPRSASTTVVDRLVRTLHTHLPTLVDPSDSQSREDAETSTLDGHISDEQRVLSLVERNGGRVKQSAVITETGWSEAKVSRLLTSMEDDEEITRYRIGREKVLRFPEQ